MAKTTKKRRIDGRKNNGGKREGAGRPYRPITLLKDTHFGEKIVVMQYLHGQPRRVKTTRMELLLETLFKAAMNGKLGAIRVYLNLVLGNAKKAERVAMREALHNKRQLVRIAVDPKGMEKSIAFKEALEKAKISWMD